jgi:hypothetical protein
MIYAPEFLYDPKIPGKINIEFYELNWGRVAKKSVIYLFNSIKEYSILENTALISVYVSLIIGLYNIYSTIKNFFKAFFLKKQILLATFGSRFANIQLDFFEKKSDLIYKIYIYNFEELLINLIWKFLNGLLIIVPILLIVAYSTLFERKALSSIQKR